MNNQWNLIVVNNFNADYTNKKVELSSKCIKNELIKQYLDSLRKRILHSFKKIVDNSKVPS